MVIVSIIITYAINAYMINMAMTKSFNNNSNI